ncbi:hypothetical protein EDEG_01469 [Edhazardia aedis USNM 41457]|uniref:Uncharacterized protein n=1 Tax=Edhazardia aedis (strain USNM 41457) TaxID=1003232 RepID=J9DNY1_EDHAE|nr:hypothetical protein EDEG_01469 [Edhazardia aedis USNM 41457]|eukprot:EJW04255.1 hypothetical protein EDEG_01469 [Edhazardia aedis USNM 41457]
MSNLNRKLPLFFRNLATFICPLLEEYSIGYINVKINFLYIFFNNLSWMTYKANSIFGVLASFIVLMLFKYLYFRSLRNNDKQSKKEADTKNKETKQEHALYS